MTTRKISIKPCNHGYDPNLMMACIETAFKELPGAELKQISKAAVSLYCQTVDLVNANGGELEVPNMKHRLISKEGAC